MRDLPNGEHIHNHGSFGRYIAPNLINCGSAGSYRPRLGRRDGSRRVSLFGPFFFSSALTVPPAFHYGFLVFSQQCPWKTANLVLMRDSFLCPSSGQIPQVSGRLKRILLQLLYSMK